MSDDGLKAQKTAEENKLKNRKKCKLDRYKNLRWSVVALLKEKMAKL